MRFTLPAVLAFLAADASSAARGPLRQPDERGDRKLDRRLGKPAPADPDAATFNPPETSTLSERDQTEIVMLTDDCVDIVQTCCDALARDSGGTAERYYPLLRMCEIRTGSMGGLSAANAIDVLTNDRRVESVEHNQPVFPSGANSWGLDRIDQPALPLDDSATKMDANGTRVFIIDTGVKGDHNDFTDLLGPDHCHINTSGDGGAKLTDTHGHGTHVASTACGLEYGVAANCEICAVQVLASNGGTYAAVIAGIEFAVQNCQGNQLCVANMSLGGSASTSINNAVQLAHEEGVVVVVAAGNSNQDACNYSPAGELTAITVGSTTSADAVSDFSNYGSCVDVYDPGSAITAAWIGSNDATNTISGTSMASPHVAGIAAGHIGQGNASTPDEVANIIKENVLNHGFDPRSGDAGIATIFSGGTLPPTSSPTPCAGQDAEVLITTDNYPGETSWTLAKGGNVAHTRGGYTAQNAEHVHEVCLSNGEWEFTIDDSYGDGMCCTYGEGSYTVKVNGVEMVSGAEFTTTESKTFDVSAPSPPPNTPPPVTPTTPPPTPAPVNSTPPPTKSPTSPTPPPVAGDGPGGAPAPISIDLFLLEFDFDAHEVCVNAADLEGHVGGAVPDQCAQACAVLAECDGFVEFQEGSAGAGTCVLSGEVTGGDDCASMWYYDRKTVMHLE